MFAFERMTVFTWGRKRFAACAAKVWLLLQPFRV